MSRSAPSPRGTVLITGAARRIGRAIALDMARDGWAVAIHYGRSAADAESSLTEPVPVGAPRASVGPR